MAQSCHARATPEKIKKMKKMKKQCVSSLLSAPV
jgi:hypothetical protein